MAENDTGAAVQDSQAGSDTEAIPFTIQVEDAGPATKKVRVEIPKERVAQKLTEQYSEIRQEAAIPGFRKGHAPKKLIEKRFGQDIKDQVRRALISESYQEAITRHSLSVLGEPEFENAAAIELKDDQPLSYTFQVEVQPQFTVPEVKGIKVQKPKITITDDHVNQALQNLLEQQGTLLPIEDRGVQERDQVTADLHVKVDGKVVGHQHNATFVARPGRIGGFEVNDLGKALEGARTGETRTVNVKGADNHAVEAVRGKDAQIDLSIKDIKKLEPAELNHDFLESLGFSKEQELRDALREQMEERIDFDVKTSMRQQVARHLVEKTTIELPTKLSQRQAERVVSRRATQLLMRGVSREVIQANIQRLTGGADQEAISELKSFFILQKIAEEQNIDVSEGELNQRVATMALQQGRRPEKAKQEMAKDGSLANLYVQLREEKALDTLLQSATIEEIDQAPTMPGEHAKDDHADRGGQVTATDNPPAPTEPPQAEGGAQSST